MNPLPTPEAILAQYWGYDSFRGQQKNIIESVLAGKRTLALLPTGGGKSICFQVPALMRPGLCLVISPLIALMKDQIENLRQRGIGAEALVTGMQYREINQALQRAAMPETQFLYVSPERLESRLFLEYLDMLSVSMVAIDEAHCISQWGFDFRPPYRRIPQFLALLPDSTPVLALTASATPDVQDDICQLLSIPRSQIFSQSFLRPALSYTCRPVEAKMPQLLRILTRIPGSGIVYCKSRNRTQRIAQELNAAGVRADWYHAGLSSQHRSEKQEAWIRNDINIMVCTNAFGMGIDKPDVRLVVHYDIPDCLEHYYQEAGRAGRDGEKAYAVALYEEEDIRQLQAQSEKRFPPLIEVQRVYESIANYLQVPIGLGSGQYYGFEVQDFCRKFDLNPTAALHAMRWLEIEGYLRFNEQVFLPSQVQFTCSRQSLQAIEEQEEAVDAVVKTLLRNYEGIFDTPVAISEKRIAYLAELPLSKVQSLLDQLHRRGIIQLRPQLNTPQVQFLYPRIRATEIKINEEIRQARKLAYETKLADFLDFLRNDHACRSTLIGQYFGDLESADCGICDNCARVARQQKRFLQTDSAMRSQILDRVSEGPQLIQSLLLSVGIEEPAQLHRHLQWLVNEGMIEIEGTLVKRRS